MRQILMTFGNKYRIGIFLLLLPVFIGFRHAPMAKGVKIVVIDAGHGGTDPGCHGLKYNEKDVALAITLKLGKYIEENFKDVKVVYTRKTDVFVPLNEIADHANKNNADLFICIHCNASVNHDVFGSETYVMGLHKTKGNLEVAKRENAAVLYEENYQNKYEGFDVNSPEANIIFSMYQNAFLDQSISFAGKVQENFSKIQKLTDKGVKQAGFLVLWKTSMPSVLIETGFLSNPEEEKYLGSAQGQNEIAFAIYTAFKQYKAEIEGTSVKSDVYGINNTQDSDEEKNKSGENETQNPKLTNKPDLSNNLSEENTAQTPSLQYKIQVLRSEKKIPLNSAKFSGLKNMSESMEDNFYKYFSGNYNRFEDAVAEQRELKKNGFNDAFIVAFKNGKKITVQEALSFEKSLDLNTRKN